MYNYSSPMDGLGCFPASKNHRPAEQTSPPRASSLVPRGRSVPVQATSGRRDRTAARRTASMGSAQKRVARSK